MKPHKHAALIKAWADGAIIQQAVQHVSGTAWIDVPSPAWYPGHEYRVKTEPKPDVVLAYKVKTADFSKDAPPSVVWNESWDVSNLRLTFDGETGKLKSAEVLK